MIKLAAKWALIGGIINIIFGLIYFILDIDPGNIAVFLAVAVMIAVLIFGSFEYRDKYLDGFASFGDLFKFGLTVSVIIAFVIALWALIYPIVIDPNMIDKALLQTEIELEERGLSQDQIDLALTQTKMFMKPHWIFIMQLMGNTFMGGLISLIASIILRKEKPQANLEG